MDWREHLARFHQRIQEIATLQEGDLRFKAKFVTVSQVAGQYYCEKKVELTRLHGEEETAEMRLGKLAHEELLKDTVKVKREETWRRIFAGEFVGLREMLLLAEHNGTRVAGAADAVCFDGGMPIALFEHKFSRNPVPFQDHHIQAQLYCYLLQQMGFDVRGLKYMLVMAPPECKDNEEVRKIPAYILKHLDQQSLTLDLPQGKVRIYIHPYTPATLLPDLEWALSYWRQKREAQPTTKAGKCHVCPFHDTCEFSLAPTT